ncbi:hypothetical protein NU688_32405 [Variovorax sp. ZS18.2.2]|nr:hypothetical protein [Variovorax sp. ZS18.2.2]MCR6480898.1 hypothetical protein [Variovorax sp. ZS18.2.2]
MTLSQFSALCECTGLLDRLRDAVDQLPVMVIRAFHLQRLELRARIDALPDRPLGLHLDLGLPMSRLGMPQPLRYKELRTTVIDDCLLDCSLNDPVLRRSNH